MVKVTLGKQTGAVRPAKIRGNCYAASEALYHLLGGKEAGWKPMQMHHEGDSHWFLQHESGLVLDPTVKQFKKTPRYEKARGRGFLTKKPSIHAQQLISSLLWRQV